MIKSSTVKLKSIHLFHFILSIIDGFIFLLLGQQLTLPPIKQWTLAPWVATRNNNSYLKRKEEYNHGFVSIRFFRIVCSIFFDLNGSYMHGSLLHALWPPITQNRSTPYHVMRKPSVACTSACLLGFCFLIPGPFSSVWCGCGCVCVSVPLARIAIFCAVDFHVVLAQRKIESSCVIWVHSVRCFSLCAQSFLTVRNARAVH